jgi:hypothetical protein
LYRRQACDGRVQEVSTPGRGGDSRSQEKSARIVGRVQRFFPVAVGIVVALVVYVTWLILRIWR